MRVLVTGARGFVGRNLLVRLQETGRFEVVEFNRGDPLDELATRVAGAGAVVHLAGENRPQDSDDFMRNNAVLTERLCEAIARGQHKVPLLMASSIQAANDSPYGTSKRRAEDAVRALATEFGNPARIYRLPNVFGKWSRPNYNSVVATFCHNIARDVPVRIDDPSSSLRLIYVDDLCDEILAFLDSEVEGVGEGIVEPEYAISVGELADQIRAFSESRGSLVTERVGAGLVRALYSTYLSYLPAEKFAYDVPVHGDARGIFVEMLKTPDCGQFSFFTAHPGVTRGGHYHHSKTEKFLVLKGRARFGFRHILTDERFEITTTGDKPQIVETIPGWSHDITNTGEDELVVMLWANEIFDRARPDTIASGV